MVVRSASPAWANRCVAGSIHLRQIEEMQLEAGIGRADPR